MNKSKALFFENFDLPETTPDIAVIEPIFSIAELSEARAAAWQEGHAAGLLEASETDTAAARKALEAIAVVLARGSEAMCERVDRSAEAIAQLLLGSLSTAFPQLCKEYGDAEVRAVVRTVLPALAQEPVITLQADPRTATVAASEIEMLDPTVAARLRISECEDLPPGDVRFDWRNGGAVRDARLLWRQVAGVLMPMGLLPMDSGLEETINGD